MKPDPVGFGVLGPLELTVGGTPVPLGSRKQRAVLAMLLISRNRVVDSEASIVRVGLHGRRVRGWVVADDVESAVRDRWGEPARA